MQLEKYGDSDTKRRVDSIEGFLDFNNNKRDKVTTQLITSFALCETGEKLSNKLRDQRIYLRDSYQSSNDRLSYIDNMKAVADVMHLWNQSDDVSKWKECVNQSVIEVINNDDEALICLQFLSKLNHTIAIPLLSRFLRDNNSKLSDALKAITAYAVLWRSIRSSTAGIDNTYRSLMRDGFSNCVIRGSDGIEQLNGNVMSFCRASGGSIDIDDLRKAFRHCLYNHTPGLATDSKQIFDKERWLNELVHTPVYDNNKYVTRFMLIVAFDNVVSVHDSAGLVQKAKDGVIRTLNREFNDLLFQSIEHISPQSKVYDGVSEDKLHMLGNLTLLPDVNNKSASNRTLEEKQKIFLALSQETKKEQEEVINSYGKFSDQTKRILSGTSYLPFCKSLSSIDTWNNEIIDERTKNLGEMVWDKLAVEWLGFDQ